jgi:hypothetical protein
VLGCDQGKATIRLSPAGRDRAAVLYNAETIRALRATASPPDQDGWVRAVVPIESTENAQAEFLRLGADVEIIEPAELRARISAVARSLAAIYPPHQPAKQAPRSPDRTRAPQAKRPRRARDAQLAGEGIKDVVGGTDGGVVSAGQVFAGLDPMPFSLS